MIKRYYIQDYPENFRGDTEARTTASDFISNQATEKNAHQTCSVGGEGRWLFTSC